MRSGDKYYRKYAPHIEVEIIAILNGFIYFREKSTLHPAHLTFEGFNNMYGKSLKEVKLDVLSTEIERAATKIKSLGAQIDSWNIEISRLKLENK